MLENEEKKNVVYDLKVRILEALINVRSCQTIMSFS